MRPPRRMELALSGKFSPDVADDARVYMNELRDLIESFDLSQVPAKLKTIVYFSVIISNDFAVPVKDHRYFSHKEQAEFVNVEISHSSWLEADAGTRRMLIRDRLVRAIVETRPSRLSAEAKQMLVDKLASG